MEDTIANNTYTSDSQNQYNLASTNRFISNSDLDIDFSSDIDNQKNKGNKSKNIKNNNNIQNNNNNPNNNNNANNYL